MIDSQHLAVRLASEISISKGMVIDSQRVWLAGALSGSISKGIGD